MAGLVITGGGDAAILDRFTLIIGGDLGIALIYPIVSLLILILPGGAWLAWFPDRRQDLGQIFIRAIGLGVAFQAVVALGFFFAGLRISGRALVVLDGILVCLTIAGFLKRQVRWRVTRKDTTVLAMFAAIVAWRLFQIRGLVLPAWVDSVHHALIVRMILENGGIPHTLAPALPIPFYYHFGFHVVAAHFAFWTGLSPGQAILIVGQILSGAIALSIYRLAMVVWGDWRQAVLAAALCGFVSEMPAYYTSWGRYTLLTGVLLLPLAMATVVETKYQPVRPVHILEGMILTAGVLLSHYVVGLLLAIFIVVIMISLILTKTMTGEPLLRRLSIVSAGAFGGALLASPWLWRSWILHDPRIFGLRPIVQLDPHGSPLPGYEASYVFSLLGPSHNYFLLLLAGVGSLIGVRRRCGRTFICWSGLLGIWVLPWTVHLGPLRPDYFAIVFFIPVCLLASYFLMSIGHDVTRDHQVRTVRVFWLISIFLLLQWGMYNTASVVNPASVLATPADRKALQWIERNTRTDARFFINVTPWQWGVYRGVDGGYWILAETGRQQLLPPALYAWGNQQYMTEVGDLIREADRIQSCTSDLLMFARKAGITHFYLSSNRGTLRPEALATCPYTQLRYSSDGVSIFEVSSVGRVEM